MDGLKDHNDHQSTWVNINVAGATFIIKRDLLKQHPNTLLGELSLVFRLVPVCCCSWFDSVHRILAPSKKTDHLVEVSTNLSGNFH